MKIYSVFLFFQKSDPKHFCPVFDAERNHLIPTHLKQKNSSWLESKINIRYKTDGVIGLSRGYRVRFHFPVLYQLILGSELMYGAKQLLHIKLLIKYM